MSQFNGGETGPRLRNTESEATSNADLRSDASFIKQHLVKQVCFSPSIFSKLFSSFGGVGETGGVFCYLMMVGVL